MLYEINNDWLHVKISSAGAEIQSLFSVKENRELLWQADEKHWARHAPILFPIIGKLKNNTLITNDKKYPMSQHGFVRDSEFSVVSDSRSHIKFALTHSDKTLMHYPFEFELQVEYQLKKNRLECHFFVINPARKTLPFSLGGHPAFNWPLQPSIPKQQHRITFNEKESGKISALKSGLIYSDDLPSPVNNKTLELNERLFENDALIFKNTKSKLIRYEAIENNDVVHCIEIQFEGFTDLGIWTKPDADFICLEPWLGYSSFESFDGDFEDKAGLVYLNPESTKHFSFSISYI